jgi:RNA polymerase sigma-70 factor, ECF subfamily
LTSARQSGSDRTQTVIEASARASYGRLVALLAARDGDIAASEDALSEAFAAALTAWPKGGVPDNPDAWLLTVARNRLANRHRHEGVKLSLTGEFLLRLEERSSSGETMPDKRLALMFVCAHPAIQEDMRTPLMLQTVLGLDAARIAAAFLVSPTTMGQRLVRAKSKIKAAGIGFALPELEALPSRLDDVLQAIYAAFNTSWEGTADRDGGSIELADEAIFLARMIVSLLPNEPEALGLLALLLHCDARRAARLGPSGQFIPLKQQDGKLWSRDKIIEAEGYLVQASRMARFGRFQCEAAIQSVHAQAAITRKTNWVALKALYELLLHHRPSIGGFVSYGAVLLAMEQTTQALDVLASLDQGDVASYQPYWVTLAAARDASGDTTQAEIARQHAISLTNNPSVRAFLETRSRERLKAVIADAAGDRDPQDA